MVVFEEYNIHIVATGYNCAKYVQPCVQSVLSQTHPNFHLHLVNDGSTDETETELNQFEGNPQITVYNFGENRGACYRRFNVIKPLPPDAIILLLGLDDELFPECLERVLREYKNGKWVTYGNWKNQHGIGLPKDFDLTFDAETHRLRNYRVVKYRSTAPNTFYKFLFDKIPSEQFQLNGKWIDSTTESELMFSCLEMSGESRIGLIRDYIYKYNQNLPNGTLARLGTEYKYSIYNEIIKREKKPLLEKRFMIFTAFHEREHISKLYWQHIETLREHHNICTFAMVSDDANERLAEQHSDYFIRTENKPIGRKMNLGLTCAMKIPFDYFIQLGSDDVCTGALLTKYSELNLPFMHIDKLLIYDARKNIYFDYNVSGVCGAGRCISKNTLVNSIIKTDYGYHLWDDWKNSGLDGDSNQNISPSPVLVPFDAPQIMCLKSETGINKIDVLFHDTRKGKNIIRDGSQLARIQPEFAHLIATAPPKKTTGELKHRILIVCVSDWANYGYEIMKSMRSAGMNVDGVKTQPHPFIYENELPVETIEKVRQMVFSGEYNCVQIMHSDERMLRMVKGFTGKVKVFHTGSNYREHHVRLNAMFNPVVSISFIALGEFHGLGAKNERFVSIPIDVERLKPSFGKPSFPLKFTHSPSSPTVKGTDRIKRMLGEISNNGKSFIPLVYSYLAPYDEHLNRVRNCDVYVELFNPEINGKKYGSFGTTAIEACSLGKIVITQNLSEQFFNSQYGKSPMIFAKDETDFKKQVKRIIQLSADEIIDLQTEHRYWAVEKHSYYETGKRIQKVY